MLCMILGMCATCIHIYIYITVYKNQPAAPETEAFYQGAQCLKPTDSHGLDTSPFRYAVPVPNRLILYLYINIYIYISIIAIAGQGGPCHCLLANCQNAIFKPK